MHEDLRPSLTEQQRRVLAVVHELYAQRRPFGVILSDVAARCRNLRGQPMTRLGALAHLQALEAKGYVHLSRERKRIRQVIPVDGGESLSKPHFETPEALREAAEAGLLPSQEA